MDPFYCPCRPRVVANGPFRFSVGYYRGRKRITLAWFLEHNDAQEFAVRLRRDNPHYKIDVLQAFF